MILLQCVALPLFLAWGMVCVLFSLALFLVELKKTGTWILCRTFPSYFPLVFERPLVSNVVISLIMICATAAVGSGFLKLAWYVAHLHR